MSRAVSKINMSLVFGLEPCEYCNGTGQVRTDTDDGEGHTMWGTGELKKCICQIKK